MATYEYQEYPKWVSTPDGRTLIVADADEEAREMATEAAPAPSANLLAPEVAPEPHTSEWDTLKQKGDAIGLKVDGRWSLARLRAEIERAGNPA